jgi:hypothetical protein
MQADAAAKAGRYQLMASTNAMNAALMGYRWLNTTGEVNPYLSIGKTGLSHEQDITNQEGSNIAQMTALLGLPFQGGGFFNQTGGNNGTGGNGGASDPNGAIARQAAGAAFGNYLNSTGYKFQLGQGMQAVTGSAAARGLLNSGSTLKALDQYGQGLGSSYFSNYLSQIQGLNSQLGGAFSQANTQANQGLGTIQTIASAGSQGGAGAANALTQGAANAGNAFIQQGNAQANGIAGAAGSIGNSISNYFGQQNQNAPPGNGFGNFFGSGGNNTSSNGGGFANPFAGASASAFSGPVYQPAAYGFASGPV